MGAPKGNQNAKGGGGGIDRSTKPQIGRGSSLKLPSDPGSALRGAIARSKANKGRGRPGYTFPLD